MQYRRVLSSSKHKRNSSSRRNGLLVPAWRFRENFSWQFLRVLPFSRKIYRLYIYLLFYSSSIFFLLLPMKTHSISTSKWFGVVRAAQQSKMLVRLVPSLLAVWKAWFGLPLVLCTRTFSPQIWPEAFGRKAISKMRFLWLQTSLQSTTLSLHRVVPGGDNVLISSFQKSVLPFPPSPGDSCNFS